MKTKLLPLSLLFAFSACTYYTRPLCSDENRLPMDLSGEYNTGGQGKAAKTQKLEKLKSGKYRLINYPAQGSSSDFDICLVGEQMLVEIDMARENAVDRIMIPFFVKMGEGKISIQPTVLRDDKINKMAQDKKIILTRTPIIEIEGQKWGERAEIKNTEATDSEELLSAFEGIKPGITINIPKP